MSFCESWFGQGVRSIWNWAEAGIFELWPGQSNFPSGMEIRRYEWDRGSLRPGCRHLGAGTNVTLSLFSI